jgi:hypothetical protein
MHNFLYIDSYFIFKTMETPTCVGVSIGFNLIYNYANIKKTVHLLVNYYKLFINNAQNKQHKI